VAGPRVIRGVPVALGFFFRILLFVSRNVRAVLSPWVNEVSCGLSDQDEVALLEGWKIWAAAGSVDTGLSFLSFLELYRTDIPQC